MGSWIGGDRDGNPFVTADVLRGTLHLQSSRVLRFYLDELHELGAELSLAAHLADVSEDLRALAGTLARHLAAPERRALSAGGIRHLCAARRDRARLEVEITRAAGRRGRALRRCRGIQGRSRHAPSLADRQQFAASSRAGGCGCCAAPWTASAFISPASTSGRTPTCMSAPSPNCSTRRRPAWPIWR